MKKRTIIEKGEQKTQLAGVLMKGIVGLLNLPLEDQEVIIYPGVIKHIKKRHLQAYKHYLRKIPEIISHPDYVGVSSENPKKIECIKCYKECVLVAIKYNDDDKLFVSSLYIVDWNRIEKRIDYGRLVDVSTFITTQPSKKQTYRNKRCRMKRSV